MWFVYRKEKQAVSKVFHEMKECMWYTHYPTFYNVSVSLFYCLKYGHIFFSKQKMFSNFCLSCNILYIQQLFFFYASSPAVIQSIFTYYANGEQNCLCTFEIFKSLRGFCILFSSFFLHFFSHEVKM